MEPTQTLNTTPELYSTITSQLFKKPKSFKIEKWKLTLWNHHSMKVTSKNSKAVDEWLIWWQLSLSFYVQGLIGTENKHYIIRCILFSFISMNSEIFLCHIRETWHNHCKGLLYSNMMEPGNWYSNIIQAPIYTLSWENSNLYQWLPYLPLSPPGSIQCAIIKHLRNYFTWTSPRTFI